MPRRWRIVQVGSTDVGGGAARAGWSLFEGYRSRGHESWLVVGAKQSSDPHVVALPHDRYRGAWARACRWSADLLARPDEGPAARRVRRIVTTLGRPRRLLDLALGRESVDQPATPRLLDLVPLVPDVIHCHNLHNDYFDLRALPRLSRRRPLVLTLHDAWLLTGHCAHSLDCERWTSGCGHCPRLDVYPRLWRDGTAGNWARKQALAAASRLFVTAPSRWLLDRVQRSLLAPGVVDSRVIPNGVDTDRFQPAARPAARAALGLPRAPLMLLFIAEEMRRNPWKDYATLREACARVAAAVPDRRVLLVGLGDARDATERAGNLEVRLLRYEDDLARVARYYQAADVYLHASRADTFPYAVLEAMACGTPVVATAVGGIPEQLDDGATGRLVPPGDAAAMAAAVLDLARDPAKRAAFGTAAVAAVRRRFGLARCVDEYLAWYESVATRWERP